MLGDPRDANKSRYTKFESLRKTFFKYGFGKIDIQKYFNLIKSYIDPSLFENLEKIISTGRFINWITYQTINIRETENNTTKNKINSHIDSDNKKVKDKKVSRIYLILR